MSPTLPQLTNDVKSPSAEPTTQPLPREFVLPGTLTTPFQWVGLVLSVFLSVGMVLAMPPVAIVAAVCMLTQTSVPMWTLCKLYLGISGLFFVIGSSAEAFGYVGWRLWARWSTKDGIGGASRQEYGHPVTTIYAWVLSCLLGF
ncbi:hypothetical protein F4818DRAFT_262968 [Hypoxylon cercidicola]|nr:hypothetical protein F4818DRAFT_262968 [Hypoxylon cercidicola]